MNLNFTLFGYRVQLTARFFIAKIQWVTGMTSQIMGTDKHYYLNDFDNCTLERCINELNGVIAYAEREYGIIFNDVDIMSDKEGSYRCISYTPLTFRQLIRLIELCDNTDLSFLYWALVRKKASIRLSAKANREKPNSVIHTITGNDNKVPTTIERLIYETQRS